MYKVLVFLACISAACAQGTDLTSIMHQIFGNSTDPATAWRYPAAIEAPARTPSTIVPPFINTTPSSTGPEPCVTDLGQQGECVRYFQCNQNHTINVDGIGIIESRIQDGFCRSYLDVCCLPHSQRPVVDPIMPKHDNTTENRVGCGYLNPNGIGFLIKGDVDSEAKFGEFPWMVAIVKVEPVNDGQKLNGFVGGGSLIHPSVVLTAAHNLGSPQELRVRAGEWDRWTKNEMYAYQERAVSNVTLHKGFNKGNMFYDVGLLFLSAPVEPAPHIGVACLPRLAERARAGARCLASGWGEDSFRKEGRYQGILKRVEVPVVDRNTCQQSLRETRLGFQFVLHTSFMCAGGERGKDTCKGDGGSPLVCPIEFEKDRYVQNGIVSWGIGCGENGTPGVYVDVAKVRKWIDNEVAGRGYDVDTYSY